jgi:hypothetical protein
MGLRTPKALGPEDSAWKQLEQEWEAALQQAQPAVPYPTDDLPTCREEDLGDLGKVNSLRAQALRAQYDLGQWLVFLRRRLRTRQNLTRCYETMFMAEAEKQNSARKKQFRMSLRALEGALLVDATYLRLQHQENEAQTDKDYLEADYNYVDRLLKLLTPHEWRGTQPNVHTL